MVEKTEVRLVRRQTDARTAGWHGALFIQIFMSLEMLQS